MITLEEAKAAALKFTEEGLEIYQVSELPYAWIFAFRCRDTKEKPDISPVMVSKETGSAETFFPPDHFHELSDIKLLEQLED